MNRTRTLALAVILCLCGIPAFGMDVAVGARGGVGVSLFAGSFVDDLEDSLTLAGAGEVARPLYWSYRAAVFAELGLLDWFALQLECGFGPEGGSLLASEGLDREVGITANALTVPLLAVVRFDFGLLGLHLLAGPAVTVCVGPPRLIQNDGFIRSEADLAPSAGIRPSIGLIGGIALPIELGPGAVIVDARFKWGVTSLFYERDGTLSFSAVELTAGYAVELGSIRRGPK